MLCALTPNSRESSAGARPPAIASSTICYLNASGYGGFVLGISDSFSVHGKESAKAGQHQLQIILLQFARASHDEPGYGDCENRVALHNKSIAKPAVFAPS